MNYLLQHPDAGATVAALLVNFLWSSLNLRLLRSMEKRFVTREMFHAEQRIQRVRLDAINQRLDKAGA